MGKIIRLSTQGIVIILLLVGTAMADTANLTVAWEAINDPYLAGYTMVWGTSSGNYVSSQNTTVTELSIQLERGKTYYLAVRGYDKDGIPGDLSEEINAIVKKDDGTPPVISNVSVTNVTANSATVSWKTNEEAYVQVEYGKTNSLGSFTGLTNVSSVSHSVGLRGLTASTSYYFRMIAKDLSGNQALSAVLSFKTKEGDDGDTEKPQSGVKFTQITLSNVKNNAVTINWTTDKATTGVIEFGKGRGFENSVISTTLSSDHSLTISNLAASSVYYYRITATAGGASATSGVLMFKTQDRVNQPARPSSEAIYVPSVVENARMRTNLGIDNLSDQTANVNLTLVDKDGLVVASKTVQVAPRGLKQINSIIRFLNEGAPSNEMHGNIYLESDQPIRAWASQIDNTTNDPSMLLSRQTGSSRIVIPSAANTEKFTSSLVVMNVGFTTAQVYVKAYGIDGSLLGESSAPFSVPASGIVTFDNILQSLGIGNNYGPVEITSLNDVPLVAASRVASKSGVGGFFQGVEDSTAGDTQIIPHVADTAELRTNLGVNNLSDEIATVIIRLMNEGGAEVGAQSLTVAARGLTQINGIVRQLLGRSDLTNFEGYLRLQSNHPVVGWVSEIDNMTNDPGFMVSKASGAIRLLIGSTANVGAFKSSLVVVNAGTEEARVDVIMRNSEGVVQGQLKGLAIPVRGFYRSSNILEGLGVSSSYGPVEVFCTNGQPVIVTSRVYSTSGTSGFFEGELLD
jgi:hypothetical protein